MLSPAHTMSPETYQRVVAFFGTDVPASCEDFLAHRPDDVQTLITRTERRHYNNANALPRFFPASFLDPAHQAAPFAVPFPAGPRWHSLEYLLETFGERRGVMLIAPLVWQTEPLFNETIKRRGLPESIMHGRNLPVAIEIIRQTGIRSIVLERSLLPSFLEEIDTTYDRTAIDFILTFSPLSAAPRLLACDTGPIAHFDELHLSPGCPLLFQDLGARGDRYRPSEYVLWEAASDATRITAFTDHTLPALRFPLPCSITATDTPGLVTLQQ